ncbi:cell division protein CrgA, partial [Nocardioides sp. P5_C9_2]
MPKSSEAFVDSPTKVFSVRFVVALLLIAAGIGWILYYYFGVRPDPEAFPAEQGSPKAIADLGLWNYAIGFGSLLLGLAISAHPSTPLGRGR